VEKDGGSLAESTLNANVKRSGKEGKGGETRGCVGGESADQPGGLSFSTRKQVGLTSGEKNAAGGRGSEKGSEGREGVEQGIQVGRNQGMESKKEGWTPR